MVQKLFPDNYDELTALARARKLLIVDETEPLDEDKLKWLYLNTLLGVDLPCGYLLNGKISIALSGSDLVVAIKTLDGNDPSATNSVYVRIDDAEHTITAALSVTIPAATNTFGRGSATFATLEQDYFVYLGYNSTDGVVIAVAPFSYADKYGDFSVTATDEKYAAISTTTSAASADPYTVIGRFAATLSAGAGYTWTVPTFTPDNLVQRPVFDTRPLQWAPQIAYVTVGDGTLLAIYQRTGRRLYYNWELTFGSTTSISGDPTVTAPVKRRQSEGFGSTPIGLGWGKDATGGTGYSLVSLMDSNDVTIYTRLQSIPTTYLQQIAPNATTPFTWATGDIINSQADYITD